MYNNNMERKEGEWAKKIVILPWHLTFIGSHDRQIKVGS